MCLQRLSAFVQSNGVFQVHLALLQPGDDGFQFLERPLKAQFFYDWAFGGLRGNDEAPTALNERSGMHRNRHGPIIAVMAPPSQLRAPAHRNYNSRNPWNKQFPCT